MNVPSVTRYRRVRGLLTAEPWFTKRLGAEDVPICKPNGERQMFSAEVVAVTNAIHQRGHNLAFVDKLSIYEMGREILSDSNYRKYVGIFEQKPAKVKAPKPPKVPKAPKAPKPPKVPKAAKPPKAPKLPKVRKAAAKPEPAAPAVAVPSVSTAPIPVAAAPPPPAVVEPVPVPAKAEETNPLLPPGKVPYEKRPEFQNYSAWVAVVSELMSAQQLLEYWDKQPGKERRLKAIEDLIRDCLTFVVVPDRAKESQKSAA